MSRRYQPPGRRAGGSPLRLACGGCLVVVVLLTALGTVGLLVWKPPPKSPATEPAPAVEAVIAESLADADAARKKYDGATLTVTGVVDSAQWHTRREEGAFITLRGVAGKNTAAATFKSPNEEQALGLKLGSTVTVKGRLISTGVIDGAVTLMLTRCELVR